jgi:hypothetical protein
MRYGVSRKASQQASRDNHAAHEQNIDLDCAVKSPNEPGSGYQHDDSQGDGDHREHYGLGRTFAPPPDDLDNSSRNTYNDPGCSQKLALLTVKAPFGVIRMIAIRGTRIFPLVSAFPALFPGLRGAGSVAGIFIFAFRLVVRGLASARRQAVGGRVVWLEPQLVHP